MSSLKSELPKSFINKSTYHKAKWMPEEDNRLILGIQTYGTKNWTAISTFVPRRSPKQCRERWTGQLDPSLNKEAWDPQEDSYLINLQKHLGNSWAKISNFLPGRSANSVKNRYKLLLKND